jgi:hypothetical protein
LADVRTVRRPVFDDPGGAEHTLALLPRIADGRRTAPARAAPGRAHDLQLKASDHRSARRTAAALWKPNDILRIIPSASPRPSALVPPQPMIGFPMRLAPLLFATALTAPSVAFASVATLRADLSAMNLQLSFSEEREEAGQAALSDPVITGSRLRIEADHLLYDDSTGTVTLIDARFHDPDEEVGAQATAGEVVARDARSFHLANETELCDPQAEVELSPAHTEIRGLTVTPDEVPERRASAESFAMEQVVLQTQVAADGACIVLDEMAMQGITSRSPRGDTATIESVVLRSANGTDARTIDMELQNLTAVDPEGATVAQLGRMTLTGDVRGALPEQMPTDPGRALDLLIRTQGSFGLEMHDLFLEAPEELGGEEMRGHVVARFDNTGDAIDAEIDMDISNLAQMRLDLGLRVMAQAESGLAAMLGDEPWLSAVERLAIARLHFSAADRGAVDIAEETAGVGREDILARVRARLSAAPQPLVGPITTFVEGVLDGGAGFRAQPAQPVALTQLMMTGMLQPTMLGTVLNITADE